MANAPVDSKIATRKDFKQSKFMKDAVLDKISALGVSPTQKVANLARSGQLGTGIRFTKLDGATPAVFNPSVGVVLSVPTMWDPWPVLQETLRAVMETHAKSITGIDFGYTLETGDTIVGHDSQTLKVPTRTTRGSVNPSATFQEYPGMPIYNLFRTWMFDIQHPDTNASILPANLGDEKEIPAWFMSAYSMSMIFIQYDPSGLPGRIYDACVITNMFPTEIGDIGFERSLGTSQLKERSVTFSGLVQHNENTRELGYRVAELLQLHKINYNFALPGLAGNIDAKKSLELGIPNRDTGSLDYEAGDANGFNSGKGAIKQFMDAQSGSRGSADLESTGAYTGERGQIDPTNKALDKTGAAVANPSDSSATAKQN